MKIAHQEIIRSALAQPYVDFQKVVTHHYDEVFTCGQANGQNFLVRGDDAFISRNESDNYAISTCCISLSGYYRWGDKPEITMHFTQERADQACSGLTPVAARVGHHLQQRAKSGGDVNLSVAERYPGPWIEDAKIEIIKALAQKNIRGCGEFKYRQSHDGSHEYLIYCTRDGTNWTSYIVFPRKYTDSDVLGPYFPDPTIPAFD